MEIVFETRASTTDLDDMQYVEFGPDHRCVEARHGKADELQPNFRVTATWPEGHNFLTKMNNRLVSSFGSCSASRMDDRFG